MSKQKPNQNQIILSGVVGSQAYGLATPESDEDILGVYVEPNDFFLGINGPNEKNLTRHDTGVNDFTYHELLKFVRRAGLQCNPTMLELLFLDDYRTMTRAGEMLVAHRPLFLSEKVRDAYCGFAMSQINRIKKDGEFGPGFKKRRSKHARHIFRLFAQGRQLLETGTMSVKVENRDELFAIGELDNEALVARFEEEKEKFNSVESVLPKSPPEEELNNLVLQIRKIHR